jgi:hypothetical protein
MQRGEADLGDRSEVVDKVSLGHSDSGIPDGEGLVLLVGRDSDEEVLEKSEGEKVSSVSTLFPHKLDGLEGGKPTFSDSSCEGSVRAA